MNAHIITGLGFGDEAKGNITASLCNSRSLVIRYSGGANAGHTVVYRDNRHVFSNFGSGTLHGASTYWSRFCPFNLSATMMEYEGLQKLTGQAPKLFVDAIAPVTTPFDILYNKYRSHVNGHGSTGIGLSTTIQRQLDGYKLHTLDLQYPSVLHGKLANIRAYYESLFHREQLNNPARYAEIMQIVAPHSFDAYEKRFMEHVELLHSRKSIRIVEQEYVMELSFSNLVFEGAQGILLDEEFGFFPNVTRGHVSSRNAITLANEWKIKPTVCYVTRCYQTRHGNGYMTNSEAEPLPLINNEKETNVLNDYQGKFRTSPLDIDLLNYALDCDNKYANGLQKHLYITCADQFENGRFPVSVVGEPFEASIQEVCRFLLRMHEFEKTFVSFSERCDAQIEPLEEYVRLTETATV